jgi:hypothetical protein
LAKPNTGQLTTKFAELSRAPPGFVTIFRSANWRI